MSAPPTDCPGARLQGQVKFKDFVSLTSLAAATHSCDSCLETQSLPVSGKEYLLPQTTSLGHLRDAGNIPGMDWEAAEPQQGEGTNWSTAAQQETSDKTQPLSALSTKSRDTKLRLC